MTDLYCIALVGNPNCGKTALFNSLTGLRQKVANYPGATVERHSGTPDFDLGVEVLDLPGAYSLSPKSPDEAVTADILQGTHPVEAVPDQLLVVVDATNLAQHLVFVLELQSLGLPMHLALNMSDLAEREGIKIDVAALAAELDIPVTPTTAVRRKGLEAISKSLRTAAIPSAPAKTETLVDRQKRARDIAKKVITAQGKGHSATRHVDAVLLNSYSGPFILAAVLFLMFQAVFSWAEVPMDWIETGVGVAAQTVGETLPDGLLKSLINDGLLAGVGAVIVFLPQILLLFSFILILESTGYMARAAFMMDKLMAGVGLNGRAFIPLLSSFACAIPGIMAARTIADERDRLTTILISPLMTCSARLPIYTLIIAAFIPNDTVFGPFGLQGVVMFGLYLAGIVSALFVALVLRRTVTQGKPSPFMMELPKYQLPNWQFIGLGLYERALIFMRRAGTIIMASTIALWGLGQFPAPPEGAESPAIGYSIIGWLGRGLEVIFAPIGFGWEISVAMIPGLAAREVSIAALGTIYSLSGSDEAIEAGLVPVLQAGWSLPTALSFLAWYIFAPMCLSTIAVTKRETCGWRWPLFMFGYLFTLAYLTSFITYQLSKLFLSA